MTYILCMDTVRQSLHWGKLSAIQNISLLYDLHSLYGHSEAVSALGKGFSYRYRISHYTMTYIPCMDTMRQCLHWGKLSAIQNISLHYDFSSTDSRRASCQLLAKECALNTGNTVYGRLVEKQCGLAVDCLDMTIAVFRGC